MSVLLTDMPWRRARVGNVRASAQNVKSGVGESERKVKERKGYKGGKNETGRKERGRRKEKRGQGQLEPQHPVHVLALMATPTTSRDYCWFCLLTFMF